MGRTGTTYAYEQYGVKPDILTTAKALGGGVPVGAFLVTERVAADSLEPGDHGSTYGGNPLVLAAVSKSIDIIEGRRLPENVQKLTPYFEKILDSFTEKYDFVKGHRGLGFIEQSFRRGTCPSFGRGQSCPLPSTTHHGRERL